MTNKKQDYVDIYVNSDSINMKPLEEKNCFISNNIKLIEYYKRFYSKSISVEEFKQKILQFDSFDFQISDFTRFRVFLDSVLLIYNNEKVFLEYLKNQVEVKTFFDEINKPNKYTSYLSFYKDYMNNISGIDLEVIDQFYISIDKSTQIRPYDQFKSIRNGMSHMQYGFFSHDSNDFLSNYILYNYDKGEMKRVGFVLEPVFHIFVQKYFSNYPSNGVPYKLSWIAISPERNVYLNSVTMAKSRKDKIIMDDNHPMMNFFNIYRTGDQDKINTFLSNNSNIYDFKQQQLSFSEMAILMEQIGIDSETDINFKCENIKSFYDLESEFSNFLVHMIQLNDCIINYLQYKQTDQTQLKQQISLFINQLNELNEDTNKHWVFTKGFELLNLYNICLWGEDSDLENFDLTQINTNDFSIGDPCCLTKYYRNNKEEVDKIGIKFIKNIYVMERLRNSLMHGHIRFGINRENQIEYIFSDIHNTRIEEIHIEANKLKTFLIQSSFDVGSIKLTI